MRFGQQRASVGGSTEAEAGVARPRSLHPARALFITPRAEVDELCRLALVCYLHGREAELASAVADHLDGGQTVRSPRRAPPRAVWARLEEALDELRVVDPACGEGHMLLGMLDLLDRLLGRADRILARRPAPLSRRRRILHRNLYGVEAQEATLARARRRLQQAVHGPNASDSWAATSNLIAGDSLVERHEFHWAEHFRSTVESGGFHLVIGNPPYVRHERIADPLGRLPGDQYKRLAFFTVQRKLDEGLAPSLDSDPIVLSRRSDLSLLFTVFGMSLLRPGGVLGFVLPTALSSAAYGAPLRRLLGRPGFESRTVENLARRSFADAAVNTALLLARRETRAADGSAGPNAVIPHETALQVPASSRAAPECGAPSSGLHRLQRRIEDRCTPLGSLGYVRYPIKTGLNCFFYPDAATCARFQIEPEFLIPVVKSPRDIQSLTVRSEDLAAVLFRCSLPPAELRQAGARGALAYVSWGAAQTRSGSGGSSRAPLPWPSIPSLRGRDPWYSVPLPARAQFLGPRFIHRRFFFALPEPGIVEDQTLYGLALSPEMQRHRLLLGALLNSSLAYLLMELHGRTGLGDGVRQYALRDLANLPVLAPRAVDAQMAAALTHAFEAVASRPMRSIEEEVVQADREELDTLVCRALGLSGSESAGARDYLTALVERRLQRARSC